MTRDETFSAMNAGDNNSTRKFRLEPFIKEDGSPWVRCVWLGGRCEVRWIPALRDLHRVLQCMASCEDERYPPPAAGRGRLLEFLRDAVQKPDWPALARKYHIPDRDGDTVVNANGADLSRRRRLPLDDNEALDREILRLDATRSAR